MSTTYYVSSGGSDNNSGTSASSPWKSVGKVNSHGFGSGDTVLFQGGQTFSGELIDHSSGSSGSNITFASYGSGKATINSGGSTAFLIGDASHVTAENLNFTGSSNGIGQFGIMVESGKGASDINLINIASYGFGNSGLMIQSVGGATISGVNVKNSSFYNNAYAGIRSQGNNNSIKSLYIGYCSAYDNYGTTAESDSGNGMWLGDLNGATLEYNNIYSNGASHGNGNSGIMVAGSLGVTIQYNIVHNDITTGSADGDGIDLDLDTQNSVVQYNYTYSNDGSGYMFDQWSGDGNFKNNTVRFNISQNDARKDSYAGFTSFGQVANCYVYNNVIYMNGGGNSAGMKVCYSSLGGSYAQGLHFANNVIMTGNRDLIDIPSNELHGTNITFTGNVYDAFSGTADFVYGSTYTSLSSFASATGQEKLNGSVVGLQVNPAFVSAGNGAALTSATQLRTLTAYELTKSSPLIGHGVNVSSLYGVSAATADFYGDKISASTAVVGADAIASNATATGSSSSSSSTSSSSSSSPSSSSSSSSTSSTGTVSGTITEGGKALAGVTVYLDANNDAKLDNSEKSTTTSSAGTYSFTGVSAGAYVVRQVLPSSTEQTAPSNNYGNHVTVSKGSNITGQNFTDAATASTVATINSSSLPSGWSSADIGSVAKAGSVSYAGSTYAVAASGSDIWGTSDSFRYTYTTLSGNGQIVAELDSESDTDDWTKAGLMIRSTTAANAQNVSLTVSSNKYALLQSRTTAGASTVANAETSATIKSPEYLKLVRSGNVITGYLSTNGTNWTDVSSATVAMGTSVEIGLAVTSHDNGTLANASFSNVAVS